MGEPQSISRLSGAHNFSGGQNHIGGHYYPTGDINFIYNNSPPQQSATESADFLNECLCALLLTDPRQDRQRILLRKDELLSDTCEWVCHDETFTSWWDAPAAPDQKPQILCIYGDAGKGKTMMMIALTKEIERRITASASAPASSQAMAYYFCQSANASTNHAHAVVRGLIYHLVSEYEHLLRHVVKHYRASGAKLFESPDTLDRLWRLLQDICADPDLDAVYLLVDALDECDHGIDDLLQMMSRHDLALPRKVKWLVSSRNESRITNVLGASTGRPYISLESNAGRVSQAIQRYIDIKVQDPRFAWADDPETASAVASFLLAHADGTFLWVWLVFQELYDMDPFGDVLDEVKKFPSGLDKVYARMLERVTESRSAPFCFALLRAAEIAPRPLRLDEAPFVADLPQKRFQKREVTKLSKQCGSFFVIRDDTLVFVHKSALDYLRSETAKALFRLSTDEAHAGVCARSLNTMMSDLQQDMCKLSSPGTLIDHISSDLIQQSISVPLQYACGFWAHHFQRACPSSATNGKLLPLLERFFQTVFLYWVESMSLLRNVIGAVRALRDVELRVATLASSVTGDLAHLVLDARHFMSEFRNGVEQAPLQAYHAGLLFCPEKSHVRRNFGSMQDSRVDMRPLADGWNACLHALEGHSSAVTTVAFAPNDKLVASGSDDETVRIWSAETGQPLRTLSGHSNWIRCVVFSPDSTHIASGSMDKTVRIWEVETGQSRSFQGHSEWITSVVFSSDGKRVASGSDDTTIRIWDVETGQSRRTLVGHSGRVITVAFPDLRQVVSVSDDTTVRIWNVDTGQSLHTLEHYIYSLTSVMFSPDCKQAVSASDDASIRIWDIGTGQSLRTLEGHSSSVRSVGVSSDGKMVVSGSNDMAVRVWDAQTGQPLCTLQGHSSAVRSVASSSAGRLVVSGANDKMARIWDVGAGRSLRTVEGHSDRINSVVLSPDGRQAASGSIDKTVRIWDVETGESQRTLVGHSDRVTSVAWSPSSARQVVASASYDTTVCIWDVKAGQLLRLLSGHSSWVQAVIFSPDGKQLASGSCDMTVILWDAETGQFLRVLQGHTTRIVSVVFSPDGTRVASAGSDQTVRIWEASTGVSQRLVENAMAENASQLRRIANWDAHPLESGAVQLSADAKWLVHPDGQSPWIWIPSELRPSAFAASRGCAVLATGSGRVSFLLFKQ